MATQEDLENVLIDRGVALLESDGLEGLTVRAVARAAGVSHGAPRRHFPTLQALRAAVAQRGLDQMGDRILTTTDAGAAPRSRLVCAATEYVHYAVEHPEMFALMFRHDLLSGSGANLRATSLPLFGFVEAAVQEITGDFAHLRALQIWTAVHGIAVLSSTRALEMIAEIDANVLVEATVASILGVDQPTIDFTEAGS